MQNRKLKNLFSLTVIFCLLFLAQIQARAQANFADTLVLDLPNGSAISFQPETIAIQAANSLTSISFANLKQQVVKTSNGRVHRFLYDEENNVLFGYDIVLETNTKLKQLKISVLPMAAEEAQSLREKFFPTNVRNRRKVRLLTLPGAATPQIMAAGEAVSFDLLVSSQLGLKITDKLRFYATGKDLPTAPARDFTLNNIELAVKNTKISVNGEEIAENISARRFAGSLLWFHLQDKGLFVFSLTPREGYDFRKIGTVEDKKIRFELDGDIYEWTSSEKIAPLDGAWSLWVWQKTEAEPFGILPPADAAQKKPSAWFSSLLSLRDFVVRIVPFVQKDDLPDLSNAFNFNFLRRTNTNSFNPENTENIVFPTMPNTDFRPPRLRVGGTNDLEALIPKNR